MQMTEEWYFYVSGLGFCWVAHNMMNGFGKE